MTTAGKREVVVALTNEPIEPNSYLQRVASDQNGALNLFLGVTRNHHDGRAVTGLEYHCYESMALDELRRVADAVAAQHDLETLIVVHRLGRVGIGETSLLVAAGSHHRHQALLGTLDLIDKLKQSVPIWKREYFADGQVGWVEGATIVSTPREARENG